ncbi:MAG TPA: hypothetical protein VJM08_13835 [Anaerolineales bacterium]|nr:hypothetical protein [Anaerolineales bacterium]
MRNVSAAILRLFAIILAAGTVIVTIFVLLLLSFNRILLNPTTYIQALAENKIYEQLPAVAAQEFSLVRSVLIDPCEETMEGICLDQSISTAQGNEIATTGRLGIEGTAFLDGMDEEQWKAVVLHLLKPEDLQESAEATVNETIAFFKGERDSVKLPLIHVKARLSSIADEELTLLLLNSQPICTLEQQTLIMTPELGKVGSPPIFCSATGGTAQALLLDLQRRLNIVASEIPDYAILVKPPSPSNPPSLQRFIGDDLQDTLHTLHTNSQYLPFLPFALLLLVTVFGVRSWRGLLRWWGIPVFIASLLTLVLGFILFFMFDQIWLNYVLTHLPPLLMSGFGELIYGVAHSLANDLSQQIMLQAGIVTLLALGIILISNRIPPPPDPSLPPLAPPGTPGGPVLNPNKKKKKW